MTDREALITKAILEVLKECGEYLLLSLHVQASVDLKVPQLRKGEFDEGLRYLESRGRIRSVQSERGEKWQITDEGRAALMDY